MRVRSCSCALMRLTLIRRRDSCVCRASVMEADTNMSGRTIVHSKICSDSTFCRSDAEGNGSRPCITYQIAVNEMMRRHRLSPPEPNRAVAQNNKARGINRSAGVSDGETGSKPKTKKVASTVLIPSNAASQQRLRVACFFQKTTFEAQSTITGTIVSSANALVQNRPAPSNRYPRPQPVRTTPAASRNEVAKGATSTPNSTKMKTPLTVSNTLVGRTNCPTQNAPINASHVLLVSQAAAVHAGTPAWSWARKCAGITATRSAHQIRRGANRRTARRIALGGQKAEFGWPVGVKANPTRVPT